MAIVFAAFLACSLLWYKKTVLLTASSLLFLPQLASGIAGVKMLYAVSIWQIVLFYFKGYHRRKSSKYPVWLLIPSVTTAFGYVMSDYYGTSKNLPIVIVNCMNYFYYPYIVWHLLDSRIAIRSYLRCLLVFFFLVATYAVAELAMGQNVVAEYFRENGLVEGLMGREETRERFGLMSCSSILPYPSSLGMLSSLVFFTLLNMRALEVRIDAKLQTALLFLLPFCVLLSGSRSQFCVLAACCLPILFWKDFLKTGTAKVLLLSAVVLLVAFSGTFQDIIFSIINSNEAAMGSSVGMREEQLDICLVSLSQSPVWGNGRNYIWEYVAPYNPALHGAESVWFQIMVDYGLVGCFNYLFVVAGAAATLYKKSFVLCFLPAAFLIGKTVSIVIGVELSTLIVFTVLLYKMYEFRAQAEPAAVSQVAFRMSCGTVSPHTTHLSL